MAEWIWLGINFLVSALAGWSTSYGSSQVPARDQFVVGIAVFLGLEMIHLWYTLSPLKSLLEEWNTKRDWHCDNDELLRRLCVDFHSLLERANGKHDLFSAYFDKQIREVAEDLRDVLTNDRMTVDTHHFLWKDNVLQAFESSNKDKTWRFTWYLTAADERLFEEPIWRSYFEVVTSELVPKKKVRSVRTLFIVSSEQLIHSQRVQALFEYFHSCKGLECRWILGSEYAKILSQAGIAEIAGNGGKDFGIYGDSLLYVEDTNIPEQIRGTFHREHDLVLRAITFFDKFWQGKGTGRGCTPKVQKRTNFAELVERDKLC